MNLGRFLLLVAFAETAAAFAPHMCSKSVTTRLDAKRMKNKQAEMARKMELAKKQKAAEAAGVDVSSVTMDDEFEEEIAMMSDKEIKERNDRRRFDELLRTRPVALNSLDLEDGYLSNQQEEEENQAYLSGADRLFVGDRAPTEPFEVLVKTQSGEAIGPEGAKQLVPWLRNAAKSDYLVAISDPRQKSPELRETVKNLQSKLGEDILKRLIIINADTPAENRRWVKRDSLLKMDIYSDPEKEWMRSYTALGEKRWSMTMFIVANERIQKLARDLAGVNAERAIQNAVKSLNI